MTVDVIQADCRAALMDVEPASIPAIVTDPPYGLHFMGKAWDYDLPPASSWRHCMRVLQPGAFMFTFGGTRTFHRLACDIEDAGFFLQDTVLWLHGQGFPKGKNALKPAWEPVLLWRKPGKSTLNVDACRVATVAKSFADNRTDKVQQNAYGKFGAVDYDGTKGRWPANLILDEEAAAALDEQSGQSVSTDRPRHNKDSKCATMGAFNAHTSGGHNDAGGASRFFYCAKASPAERNAGCEGLPVRSNMRVNAPRECEAEKTATKHGNCHPTVKPVKLMRYLCRLITPPGGLVVDPFCGSGSTGVAAVQEGFSFLGIDKDAESCTIARARIAHALGKEQPQELQAAGA